MSASRTSLVDRPVLVTGATGFLGGHLCERLLKIGAEVHVTCRSGASVPRAGVRSCLVDLENPVQVNGLIRAVRPGVVFHLAGVTSAGRHPALVLPTFQANLVTTVNILSAVTDVSCGRVVIAGSFEAGLSGVASSSPYAASKSAAAAYSSMFWNLFKTPATIARIFMVYGPGQMDARKVLPYCILSLLAGQSPRLSSGTRLVDWIYVTDVVEALIAIASTTVTDGRVIDVGSGALVSIRDVVERVSSLINGSTPLSFGALPDRPDEQVGCADAEQACALTGWSTRTALDEGLAQTVDYYREHQHQFKIRDWEP